MKLKNLLNVLDKESITIRIIYDSQVKSIDLWRCPLLYLNMKVENISFQEDGMDGLVMIVELGR